MADLDITKALKNISKVKLNGGVVGKTCTVLLVVVLVILAIVWVARDIYFCYFALTVIFILVGGLMWRLINFADKNPQAALLEGGEFLVHQQIEYARKGVPNLPATASTTNTEAQPTPIDLGGTEVQVTEPDKPSEKESE